MPVRYMNSGSNMRDFNFNVALNSIFRLTIVGFVGLTLFQAPAESCQAQNPMVRSIPFTGEPPKEAIETPVAAPQEFESSDTCILLSNGQLLKGYVIRSSSAYRVQLTNNTSVTLDAKEVELHCRSESEAFEHMRRNTDIASLNQQIALCRWCTKYEMFDQATRQLGYIQRLGGDRKSVEHLRNEITRRQKRVANSQHATVSHEDESNTEDSQRKKSKLVTLAELKVSVDSLPENGFKFFANDIQAKLINSCSGCHNQLISAMPLAFHQRGAPVTRRMTEHNLHQVLKFVDRANPDKSSLLRMATTVHSNSKSIGSDISMWHSGSREFQYLRAWVHHIADKDAATHSDSAGTRHPNVQPQVFKSPQVQTANSNSEESTAAQALPVPPAPIDPTKVAKFQPMDPFDPEIFNREYGPKPTESAADETEKDSPPEIPTLPGFTGFPK